MTDSTSVKFTYYESIDNTNDKLLSRLKNISLIWIIKERIDWQVATKPSQWKVICIFLSLNQTLDTEINGQNMI